MDLSGLPSPRRPIIWPLLLLHLFQASCVAISIWALSFVGIILIQDGTRAFEGITYILLMALLLAGEIGLAFYLILRRRKMARLIRRARVALKYNDPITARRSLLELGTFLEFKLDPRRVHYGLGVACLLEAKEDEALTFLEFAGDHLAALELRGLIYLSRAQHQHAEKLIKSALALNPRMRRLWLTLAACKQALGDKAAMQKILDQMAKRWPNSGLLKRANALLSNDGYLPDMVLGAGLPAAPHA